jgi:proteic killer suppression protein
LLEVEFDDDDLERLERDREFTAGFSVEIVRGFRKAMNAIRAAMDTRDLYRGGLRTEKLKGDRQHQHSIRLNSQWRLIVQIDGSKIKIVEIEDYH